MTKGSDAAGSAAGYDLPRLTRASEGSAPPHEGMHPTADTRPLTFLQRLGRADDVRRQIAPAG